MIGFYSGWNCAGELFCCGRNFAAGVAGMDGILVRIKFYSGWKFAADDGICGWKLANGIQQLHFGG